MPKNWNMLDVFLMIRQGLWVIERNTTEVKHNFHHLISSIHTVNIIYDCWCWPWSPDWGSVCQISPQVSFSLHSFPYCAFWKVVTTYSPHFRRGGHAFLDSSAWDIYSSCFINSIIIKITMESWIFYTLGYKPIQIIYFGTQIIPILATCNSFRWLLCPFDVPHSYIFCFLLLLFFLIASLPSDTMRCSRFTLYNSCPNLRVSHLSKKPGSLIGEMYTKLPEW